MTLLHCQERDESVKKQLRKLKKLRYKLPKEDFRCSYSRTPTYYGLDLEKEERGEEPPEDILLSLIKKKMDEDPHFKESILELDKQIKEQTSEFSEKRAMKEAMLMHASDVRVLAMHEFRERKELARQGICVKRDNCLKGTLVVPQLALIVYTEKWYSTAPSAKKAEESSSRSHYGGCDYSDYYFPEYSEHNRKIITHIKDLKGQELSEIDGNKVTSLVIDVADGDVNLSKLSELCPNVTDFTLQLSGEFCSNCHLALIAKDWPLQRLQLKLCKYRCGFGNLEELFSGSIGKHLVSLTISDLEGLCFVKDIKVLERCTNLRSVDISSNWMWMDNTAQPCLDLKALYKLKHLRFVDLNGHSLWKDEEDSASDNGIIFVPPRSNANIIMVWNIRESSLHALSEKLRHRLKKNFDFFEEWTIISSQHRLRLPRSAPHCLSTHTLMNEMAWEALAIERRSMQAQLALDCANRKKQ